MEHDVVYILKNNWKCSPNELRYSLRTVEKNFPCRRVWFFGGHPDGFKPDRYRQFTQEGKDRYERVRNSIIKVCKTKEVSDDFWLFNDDFFILKPVTEDFCYDRGDIRKHARRLYQTHGFHSGYSKKCLDADKLEEEGLTTKDYTLHVPLLVNKEKALEAIEAHPDIQGFRNLYGNYCQLESTTMEDVKISDIYRLPPNGSSFLSTSDSAFASGAAGAVVCKWFPTPSRWEVI